MLSPEFGGLRPWELRDLTPSEERQLYKRLDELNRDAN